MRARRFGFVLALVATTIAGCASSSPETAQTPARPSAAVAGPSLGSKVEVAGVKANYHGTKDVSKAKRVYIEIEDNYFKPTVIKGKPGQRLLVSIENESQSPHTFTIGGTYVDLVMEPGRVSQSPLRLPKSGNLSFYCTVQKKNGMAGAFHVSGPLSKP